MGIEEPRKGHVMTFQGDVFKETPQILVETLEKFPESLPKSDDKKRAYLLDTLTHCGCYMCRFIRHFSRFKKWPEFV